MHNGPVFGGQVMDSGRVPLFHPQALVQRNIHAPTLIQWNTRLSARRVVLKDVPVVFRHSVPSQILLIGRVKQEISWSHHHSCSTMFLGVPRSVGLGWNIGTELNRRSWIA